MAVSPPSKVAEQQHDIGSVFEDVVEPKLISYKSSVKSDQSLLNVTFGGGIRAASPNPSLLSLDDSNTIPLVRGHQHVSCLPRPPEIWKGKIKSYWTANKGLALVVISQIFGSLMNVTTRLLEMEGNHGQGYDPFQILFVRMAITMICASIYMWCSKMEHFPLGIKQVRPLLVARGLTGFFGVFGMYYSLQYLPLADATVITFLAPSLACWACSFLINEPFTRMEQIAAYISLFGVVLIARPISLFSSSRADGTPPASRHPDSVLLPTDATASLPHHPTSEYDAVTPTQRAMAVGVAMLGVLGAAGAFTTLRWIGKRAHPLFSVNYLATCCTLVSMVMMLAVPSIGFLLPVSLKDWCYLLFLGICGFVMVLLAAGLQYEKSSRATNMVYTQMLFALAFDKLVWGTTPGALSIIGSSLILGSAIYVTIHRESGVKDGDERDRGVSRDEERALMSPSLVAEVGAGDEDIRMRTLGV